VTTRKRGPLSGHGYVPPGGNPGEVLSKTTEVDGDTGWTNISDFSIEYIRVKSQGAIADGSEANAVADTEAIAAAFQLAADNGGGQVVFENGDYGVATPVTPDSDNLEIIGDGATLTGRGAATIMASFSSGSEDFSTNNGLLGGLGLRSNVTQSLEDMRISGLRFVAGTAGRAIHLTRFTRGCEIDHCKFEGFPEYDILINGSWSYSIVKNRCSGGEAGGVGIGLAINGEGKGSGAVSCNAVDVRGNECTGHDTGAIWNSGVGGAWTGNAFEFNRLDGFRSQGAAGFLYGGNYHEANGNDNAQFGGTNGLDYCIGVFCAGNFFSNSVGSNIRLNATQRCVFGPNHYSGSRTQQYVVPTTYNTDNEIWMPDHTTTYVSQQANLDGSVNRIITTNTNTRPTIQGSRGGNTAVTDLLTKLATLNLIVDGTSA
jgi:hypothetical protein